MWSLAWRARRGLQCAQSRSYCAPFQRSYCNLFRLSNLPFSIEMLLCRCVPTDGNKHPGKPDLLFMQAYTTSLAPEANLCLTQERNLHSRNGVDKRRKICLQAEGSRPTGQVFQKSADGKAPPWAFGFQMNERYLNWDVAAQTQLLKLACAAELNLDLAELEARITDVSALIPDLQNKLGRMKAGVLSALLEDPEMLAHRLSVLRELMPSTNVSKLVSGLPAIVLDYEPKSLASRLEVLRSAFGQRTDVEFLVAREPNLLKVATSTEAIDKLVANVKRLLPIEDPISFVISNPGMVLDMDTGNLPSAIDGDLTQDS